VLGFLRPESLRRGRAELPLREFDPAALARLPDEFDARAAWPHCPSIADIFDQSACGDCWAVSTVTAATDRLCITAGAAAAPPQPRLSVEHMVGWYVVAQAGLTRESGRCSAVL
jgi:hypothetical protein